MYALHDGIYGYNFLRQQHLLFYYVSTRSVSINKVFIWDVSVFPLSLVCRCSDIQLTFQAEN